MIKIGSVDWVHPHWQGSFYPDSMPAEWWLTYYSNEFHCVLVPVAAARPDQVPQWVADTHERFRFFLQLGAADEAVLAQALELATALAGRLGGVVCEAAGTPGAAATGLAKQLAARRVLIALDRCDARHPWLSAGIATCLWRPQSGIRGCVAGVAPAPPKDDRRALRNCIDAFAAQSADAADTFLFFDDPELPVQTLQDATVIAQLLGV